MLILAIDDSKNTLTLLTQAADAMGYRLVASLEDAAPVETLGGETPDVAMVGWHLDGKPAGWMVRMLAEAYPLTPIIVMSSDQRPVSQLQAVRAGAWFFWCKGSTFELAELWPAALEQRRRLLSGEDDPDPDKMLLDRIRRELARHCGNVSEAAKHLGMHRNTIHRKLRDS